MATTLHTFIDIFDSNFEVEEEVVRVKKIIIPIIQRDYAQGREDADTNRVRERLLESLFQAITDKAITLDFVYGDVDATGVMKPLDGQQRLTTLFLLHWYAAKKEKVDTKEYEFLCNFSYETRYSARMFCNYLVGFTPSFEEVLSEEIIDQAWFPLEWKKDPTISSMLVMLDSISKKFVEVEGIWRRLKEGAISFYFLPIKEMGLTDELYIKMNSRGKPLTSFEHFKAELERYLKDVNEEVAKRIMKKVDIDWTDLLWNYKGEDNVIDDEFLRYFHFVTDIICYKKGGTTQGRSRNEFDILKLYFSKDIDGVDENIDFFEKCFDCWCTLQKKEGVRNFFKKYISTVHEEGKITIENKEDIFEDCLRNYVDIQNGGNRSFPLNRIILLYAIVVYLLNSESVTETEFARRLRVIHNLSRNSNDEISDSELRSSGNRMPAILRQVDSIILQGMVNMEEEKNFNPFQLEEEQGKMLWASEYPDMAERLFALEDHFLLRGQISIVGLEHPEYFERFENLFRCNWDLVDCALLSLGDYGQIERNGWKYQLGSSEIEKAWIALFHNGANQGYNETKSVLAELLDLSEQVDDVLLRDIKEKYISECESKSLFDWRYYYVRYNAFRPGRYGKCSWKKPENGFYNMHMLWTESQWSQNSYHPFLYEVAPKLISRDDLGHIIREGENYLSCENAGFYVRVYGTDEEVEYLPVQRNEDGIDTENRIEKFREFLLNRGYSQSDLEKNVVM